jgi:predicted O-methyltransferase YrrM
MARKNILFNTTRGWNPGDQFIMMGVLRLMRYLEFNKIIYNRHPNVWGKGADNSFKIDTVKYEHEDFKERVRHNAKGIIDYYIAAGTPEWDSQGIFPLFDQLIANKIRCSWIGIGCGLKLSDHIKELFKRTDVITTRDQGAFNLTEAYKPMRLPCPAFFVGRRPKIRKNSDSPVVGLVYMSDCTGANRIHPQTKPELIQQYTKALKAFPNAVVICHYIDEALEARRLWPQANIYYSYNADDFEQFFDLCDMTIGPRLHGAIFGASLGAPGFIVLDNHSSDQGRRRGGSEPLGIQPFNEDPSNDIVKFINGVDIETESRRLRYHRYLTEIKYMNQMCNRMTQVFGDRFPDCKSFLGEMPYYAPKGNVPALYARNYYQFYRVLGQDEKPRSILEIGTRYGYSLISMVLGGIDTVEHVVCLDNQSYGNTFDLPSQQVAEKNLRAVGYKGKAEFYVDNSRNLREHISEDRQFDIVHVDGDHTYGGAKKNMHLAWPNVRPGGIMIVDDIDNKSVWKAVEECIDELGVDDDNVDFMGSKHGLVIIRKAYH